MNYKSLTIYLVSFVVIIGLGMYFYNKSKVESVSYSGIDLNAEKIAKPLLAQQIVIPDTDVKDNDEIVFTQRRLTGGGNNPGWVISILETQPKYFTGRVIVDDGVYQYPVSLKEDVENHFIGEMKGVNNMKEIFSLSKTDKSCTDEEGNQFQYTLSGFYGNTQITGCGGNLVKEVK